MRWGRCNLDFDLNAEFAGSPTQNRMVGGHSLLPGSAKLRQHNSMIALRDRHPNDRNSHPAMQRNWILHGLDNADLVRLMQRSAELLSKRFSSTRTEPAMQT